MEPASLAGTYVAPHWQGSGRSETVQKGIDPSLLEPGRFASLQGASNRIRAADANYEAARIQADADRKMATAAVMADEHAKAVRDDVARKRAMYIDGEMKKLNALSQDAEKKVNPEQYWDDNGGAGGRVFAALAIALGQFGASLTGGQNAALQIIQTDIDRNIRAQQANIDNAGQSLARRRSLYAQNLEALGDPNQAYLATKAQYLDHVKTLLGQQYAAAGEKRNEAAYHDMLGKINDEQGQIYNEYAKLAGDKHTLQSSERFVPGGMVGGSKSDDRGPLYVPALGGYARDAETARKLNEKASVQMQINANMRRVWELLGEAKGLSSVTNYGRMQEIRSHIAALKNHTMQLHNVATGMGAMSKDDATVTENALAFLDVDPKLMTGSAIERSRKVILDLAKDRMENFRLEGEAAGIRRGKEKYVENPDGSLVPVSELEGRNMNLTKKTIGYGDLHLPVKGVAR